MRGAIDLTASLDGEMRALPAAWGAFGEVLAGRCRPATRSEASVALLTGIEFGQAENGAPQPAKMSNMSWRSCARLCSLREKRPQFVSLERSTFWRSLK